MGPDETVIVPLALGTAAAVAVAAAKYRTTPYDALFVRFGKDRAIDPDLLRAIAKQESNYRRDVVEGRVKSSAGAVGLMQIMPAIARAYGFTPKQMTNPANAVDVATRLLRDGRKGLIARGRYSLGHWIATYNAGLPRVLTRGEAAAQAGYVSSVIWHHTLYKAASLVYGRE